MKIQRHVSGGIALETGFQSAVPRGEEVPELMAQGKVAPAAIEATSKPDGTFFALNDEGAFKSIGVEVVDGDDTDGAGDAIERNSVGNRAILRAQLLVNFEGELPRLADIGQLHQIYDRITCAHCL